MKKVFLVGVILSLLLMFTAFKIVESASVDFLKQLGIPEEEARGYIWSSFSGMHLSYPSTSQVKNTPVGNRAATVRQIGEYAKQYTQTEEFKKKYQEYREEHKPAPPEQPQSTDDMRKEQRESIQKSIRETELSMQSLPADQQAILKEVVKTLKEQLKSVDDPNNPMFSRQVMEMHWQGYAASMEDYKKSLAQWGKDYPTSPNKMIKGWLTEFLEVSKDVDFNAQLIKGDGDKKLFAKTEYEKKPSHWKKCFRAGRETVEAGRAFAKQWLEELNKVR